jgi:hypothetical protein
METITITFGDQAENHVGMQKLGKLADIGFNYEDLCNAKNKFEKEGCVCELINLSSHMANAPEAYILIVRNGVDAILEPLDIIAEDVYDEQRCLEWDTKAKMYGRVVNKHARHNLCYGDDGQEPDYEHGKGRIVAFDDIPWTKYIKQNLHVYVGSKGKELVAEGNRYYDASTCGIGYHGDSERKKVIAIRLGESMTICYQWFLYNKPVGKRIELKLHHGDIYIMSEYATGNNWKKKNILTLRHAAGCKKYITVKS